MPCRGGESIETWCAVPPLGDEGGEGYAFGIPPTLSRCSPLDSALLRCLALCAYSVGSPIPTPHPINQSVSHGRISGQSPIRSGAWAWVGMTTANQLSARTGGRDAQDSQPIDANPLANHRPHHTRVDPTLLLARALRWGKYPVSKNLSQNLSIKILSLDFFLGIRYICYYE
jgi:hypothetical protein